MTIAAGRFGAGRRSGAERVLRALRHVLGWPGRVVRARKLMRQLGGLDEHELRDIGLTRLDLADAGAFRLDDDPSRLLRQRVAERRRRCR